jgi:hypothetical protein
VTVPSLLSPLTRRAFGTLERSAVSLGMARGLIDALLEVDVRPVLAAVSAPTVVGGFDGLGREARGNRVDT